jgi:hypothetical protein
LLGLAATAAAMQPVLLGPAMLQVMTTGKERGGEEVGNNTGSLPVDGEEGGKKGEVVRHANRTQTPASYLANHKQRASHPSLLPRPGPHSRSPSILRPHTSKPSEGTKSPKPGHDRGGRSITMDGYIRPDSASTHHAQSLARISPKASQHTFTRVSPLLRALALTNNQ